MFAVISSYFIYIMALHTISMFYYEFGYFLHHFPSAAAFGHNRLDGTIHCLAYNFIVFNDCVLFGIIFGYQPPPPQALQSRISLFCRITIALLFDAAVGFFTSLSVTTAPTITIWVSRFVVPQMISWFFNEVVCLICSVSLSVNRCMRHNIKLLCIQCH